jgi:shikimate dehydrogenase
VRDELLVEPRPGQTVVDLAYAADGGATALVAAARAAGCTVIDGLEALVRQGGKSFELWTGVPAPVDVMRAAVRSRGAS